VGPEMHSAEILVAEPNGHQPLREFATGRPQPCGFGSGLSAPENFQVKNTG
jgi:hypothetical protein